MLILLSKNTPFETILLKIRFLELGNSFVNLPNHLLNSPNRMKKFIGIFILILQSFVSFSQFATESKLATGKLYKLEVSETGVYKISHNFLTSNGVNLNGVNPNQVQILGHEGGMLPQANSAIRTDDLQAFITFVSGGADNSFDAGDFILFYAEGADKLTYFQSEKVLLKETNLYSTKNSVFLKIGNSNSSQILEQANITGSTFSANYFDGIAYVEPENFNLLTSGRDWYSDEYNFNTEESFNFQLEGIVPNSEIRAKIQVMTRSSAVSSFDFKLNESALGNLQADSRPDGVYVVQARANSQVFSLNSSSLNTDSGIKIDLTYNKGNSSSRGYLDFIAINAKRTLKLYGAQTSFRNIESLNHSISKFTVSNLKTSSVIWDISNPLQPKKQAFNLNGTIGEFQVETNSSLKEFVVFNPSEIIKSPQSISEIQNQNLHGLSTPNLLIVTHPLFRQQADELADLRRNHDKLTVEVVETQTVYNEFAAGKADVSAIRDFARMLYLKEPNKLKYLLLFGDASYNYKDGVSSFVPIYESRNSFNPVSTYSSDDYFGFFETNEGEWAESGATSTHTLEIGVGRLPAKTPTEAQTMVNKLTRYTTNLKSLGKWRKNIVLTADDGDFNTHQRHADILGKISEEGYPTYNVNRLFVDAYPQVILNGGKTSLVMREKIKKFAEDGSLIINFTGHGNERGWASENILNNNDIESWNNLDNLPLLVTATCEFGRYDDPSQVSGAELSLKSEIGGAIGLLTTTRPVFSSSNLTINKAFYESVFEPIDGEMPRIGDVIRITKNNSIQGVNNRNFSLLGDPSMRLAYPELETKITEMKFESGSSTNSISALDKVILSGEIQENSMISSSFNGELDVVVFEKPVSITTLGDDSENNQMTFQSIESEIFKGKASVVNGEFTFTLVVPKDIDYQLGEGKISLYAKDETQNKDAGGFYLFEIGGSSSNPTSDSEAPTAAVFLNDENFQNGQTVSRQPLVIATLSDASGFNFTGLGVGHDLTISIDEDEYLYEVNEFFEPVLDDFTKGNLQFQIPDALEPGKHTLKFTVFDTHNNGREIELDFVVTGELKIESLLAFPNPMQNQTTFSFTHNRAGDKLSVGLQIYDMTGKLVSTFQGNFFNSEAQMNILDWDGTGNSGSRLGNGLYIYKISVQAFTDGATISRTGKVIIDR
ncbi:MAG: hypothetical protein ACJAWV_000025 [Flammeovirgaceae bacterium]|jgi:hypothetical protein